MNSATAAPAPTSPSNAAVAAPAITPSFQHPGHHSGEKLEKQFSPLVQQFLTYLKLEKHFSEYTVKSYGADLIQFGQFMAGEIGQQQTGAAALNAPIPQPKVSPEELDKKQLACEPLTTREFLAYLYGQNYTKSTTARKL